MTPWTFRLSAAWRQLTRDRHDTEPADPSLDSLTAFDVSSTVQALSRVAPTRTTAAGTTSGPAGETAESRLHAQVERKLALARSYVDLDVRSGARELLFEVVRDGEREQRLAAAALLRRLLDG
jgi:FimV-like protein